MEILKISKIGTATIEMKDGDVGAKTTYYFVDIVDLVDIVGFVANEIDPFGWN